MSNINVKAGRVPGSIASLAVRQGAGVFEVMTLAAQVLGEKKNLGRPAFDVNRGEYAGTSSGKSVDIPQLNGRMLAEKQGDRYVNIAWDTVVADGDVVLVVPKIQGNQFTVLVARVPGAVEEVAIYEDGDEEGGDDAGTVAAALSAAGIEPGNVEIRVNGKFASLTTRLAEGDRVLVEAEDEGEEDIDFDLEDEEDLETRADRAAALADQVTEAVEAYREAKQGFESAKAVLETLLDRLGSN